MGRDYPHASVFADRQQVFAIARHENLNARVHTARQDQVVIGYMTRGLWVGDLTSADCTAIVSV